MAGRLTVIILLTAVCNGMLGVNPQDLKLEQVFMFSRHNIRSPIDGGVLTDVTPKKWPKWVEAPGVLTAKGNHLESHLGRYFGDWLANKGLIVNSFSSDIHIYANVLQRTRETARAFADSAFQGLNVSVTTVQVENSIMDPLFCSCVRNSSVTQEVSVRSEIRKKLDSLKLDAAYLRLEKLTDLKNSKMCKKTGFCKFIGASSDIHYEVGEEPEVIGPLSVANRVVDAVLMAYYNGMPMKEVGWGEVPEKTLNTLTDITKQHLNVRFNITMLAKDIAKPILKYMSDIFQRKLYKFTSLFGHDSNLMNIISAMGFEPYVLPQQYELTPIGGKLVFQKLRDTKNDKVYVKIDFVYLSSEQIRNGKKITKSNPPYWVPMKLKHCQYINGLCVWSSFMDLLKEITN